jgi:hypothetical protein
MSGTRRKHPEPSAGCPSRQRLTVCPWPRRTRLRISWMYVMYFVWTGEAVAQRLLPPTSTMKPQRCPPLKHNEE